MSATSSSKTNAWFKNRKPAFLINSRVVENVADAVEDNDDETQVDEDGMGVDDTDDTDTKSVSSESSSASSSAKVVTAAPAPSVVQEKSLLDQLTTDKKVNVVYPPPLVSKKPMIGATATAPVSAKSVASALSQVVVAPKVAHLLVYDVEACDGGIGPILALAAVHSSRSGPPAFHRQFHGYLDVACQREAYEYTVSGWTWWRKHARVHDYLIQRGLGYNEYHIAASVHKYRYDLFSQYPDLTEAIDDWHVDGSLLNNLLRKYGFPALNVHPITLGYKPVTVIRDLTRGTFRVLCPEYVPLNNRGMTKQIQDTWNKHCRFAPVGSTLAMKLVDGKQEVQSTAHFNHRHVLKMKHVPLVDVLESDHMFYNVEDLRDMCMVKLPGS